MKDYFSKYADKYSRYRPSYPQELFEYIISLVHEKELAWDCGTGNGQTAKELSKYFKKVIASDISNKQLHNAATANNIVYVQESAERSGLAKNSVDIITISQALHWFDLYKFYDEVKRVGKKKSIIAAWTYSLLQIDPVTDHLLRNYYFETLKNYWHAERKHVDDGYANIFFPFKIIPSPSFSIVLNWGRDHLAGYLNTWSATQKFIEVNNFNPVNELMQKINKNWLAGQFRSVNFPVHLKAGHVH